MVQSYLRHGPTESFGLVASSSSNSVFDGRRAYVPALEDVLVWDVKKGEQVGTSSHNHSRSSFSLPQPCLSLDLLKLGDGQPLPKTQTLGCSPLAIDEETKC